MLRGWLAVVALSRLAGYRSRYPFGAILALPLIAAAVVLSVRLGRRAQRRPYREPRQRLLAAGGNALLGLVALITLVGVQQRTRPVYAGTASTDYTTTYNPGRTLTRQDGTPITNIYPYTNAGQPLTGVLLYDQDGRALDNLSPTTGDGQPIERVVPAGSPPPPANAYPQQQRIATNGGPGLATPTPGDAPSSPASIGTAPPGSTPTAGPSESATPTVRPTPGRPGGPRPTAAPATTPGPAGTTR